MAELCASTQYYFRKKMKSKASLKYKKIKSVGFACDILRFSMNGERVESMQIRNMDWLQNLLGIEQLCHRHGITYTTIATPTNRAECEKALQNDALFTQYGIDPEAAWASQYDAADAKAFPHLFEKLREQDLIIGFELPPVMKNAVHKAGNYYISIHIHPLRFLRDLCFTVYTNMPQAQEVFAECMVPEFEVESQVRKFKAKFTRDQLPAFQIPDNTPVLIGQTEKDSVLLKEGMFLGWEAYTEVLTKHLANHDSVVFMGHPARQSNKQIIEFLRSQLNKTVISLNANSYGVLFSNTDVPFFITLASSFGVEASAAGNTTVFLLDDPRTKFVASNHDIYVKGATGHKFLNAAAWTEVLGCAGEDTLEHEERNPFYLGDNYLRDSLDGWSYNALRNPALLGSVQKVIHPSSTCDDISLNRISAGLAAEVVGDVTEPSWHPQVWGDLVIAPGPINPNQTTCIVFDHATKAQLLHEGFHASEPWGTWINGTYGKVVLPVVRPPNKAVKVQVALKVQVFESLKTLSAVVQVTCDGQDIGWLLVRPDSETKADLLFSTIVVDNTCTLEFRTSHADSPANSFGSEDIRKLSVALISCEISGGEEIETEEVTGPTASAFWGLANTKT